MGKRQLSSPQEDGMFHFSRITDTFTVQPSDVHSKKLYGNGLGMLGNPGNLSVLVFFHFVCLSKESNRRKVQPHRFGIYSFIAVKKWDEAEENRFFSVYKYIYENEKAVVNTTSFMHFSTPMFLLLILWVGEVSLKSLWFYLFLWMLHHVHRCTRLCLTLMF